MGSAPSDARGRAAAAAIHYGRVLREAPMPGVDFDAVKRGIGLAVRVLWA